MLSALVEIKNDMQEEIGHVCRDGNSEKEPKGKLKK